MPTSCGRGLPAVHQGHDDDVTYTADQLDRDAVSERQRRTVLGQFKDAVLPEVYPVAINDARWRLGLCPGSCRDMLYTDQEHQSWKSPSTQQFSVSGGSGL